MKKVYTLLMALLACGYMSAQEVDKATVQTQAEAAQKAQADLKGADTGDKAWKFSGSLGLNAAATGLWNWAAGGNNNVNGLVYSHFRLLYHKNSIAWDSNLDMEYGLSWIDQEYDKFQKSSDKLNFTTKFGWEFEKSWYLTALAGFQSQFAYGRNYNGTADFDPIISKFLAPSYTDISVGIDWKPNDIFSIYLSPVAGRITTVVVNDKLNNKYLEEHGIDLRQDLKESYAVWHYETGVNDLVTKNFDKNARAELGLSLKGSINYSYKDLKIQTTLGLYTPYAWDKTKVYMSQEDGKLYADVNGDAKYADESKYTFAGYRDNNRRFGNFDVDWVTNISYQFFNCLQVTLSTNLKYYNGVKIADKHGENPVERVQFQGIIGLGVGYTF